MVEYTSIRIRKDLNEKMQLIKKQNNYKSINELLDKTLDKTINEKHKIIQEQPVFTIGTKKITWTDLKNSKTEDTWKQEKESATILYKDEQGAFIRFNNENEVEVQYFHFI